ncbi:Chaperone protein DnaJ [Lachnellula occidentalis]|uniref:Chaperone protein DnaJ n=1 Tax=Lachnellula occidentalis TaxID=215460 RepID=A0A8H8UB55_9HELO|nr:Chaperone protein DnaJ [Lachnellula occidentalis]
MAPAPITDDYYMVLEVVQTATPDQVVRSYKRLALKLHPDRNAKHDATEAFQLLGRAYETLTDESNRRAYDLIYPSISRSGRPPPASTQQSAPSEGAKIAALQRSKQERDARWGPQKKVFDFLIFERQSDIWQLEQEIINLDKDSEEEKARKDRTRQQRRIEKDLKEGRLEVKMAGLRREQGLLRKKKGELEEANKVDDKKIQVIQDRIRARETWHSQEREKVLREVLAKLEEGAAEELERQQAEERAAEQKQQEEQVRYWQKAQDDNTKRYREQQYAHLYSSTAEVSTRTASTITCRHDGWWPKIQGRAACPKCSESWTYLLQCPSCQMEACPRCRSDIRTRIPRHAARTNRRAPPNVRTPCLPDYFPDDFY